MNKKVLATIGLIFSCSVNATAYYNGHIDVQPFQGAFVAGVSYSNLTDQAIPEFGFAIGEVRIVFGSYTESGSIPGNNGINYSASYRTTRVSYSPKDSIGGYVQLGKYKLDSNCVYNCAAYNHSTSGIAIGISYNFDSIVNIGSGVEFN